MKPRWGAIGAGCMALACGGFVSCTALVQLVHPDPAQPREEVAILAVVFGGLPALVGLVLLAGVGVTWLRSRSRSKGLAWLRGRDRFTLAEFAAIEGIHFDDVRARLDTLLRDHAELDFVFHPGAGAYLRRSQAAAGARVVDSCANCGARADVLLLPGEVFACAHCGAGL